MEAVRSAVRSVRYGERSLPEGWRFGHRTLHGSQAPVVDRRLLDGPGGYRICAMKSADGWKWSAFGPEAEPQLSYFEWVAKYRKERYARGERAPQRSELLGCFPTLPEAVAACQAHLSGTEV